MGRVVAVNVETGDAVEVLTAPDHGVTVADVAGAYHRLHDEDAAARRARLESLRACPDLSEGWREWAAHELDAG